MSPANGSTSDVEAVLVDSLSPRERQLLDMATNGLTDQAIANELGISLATVSTYWGRIRIKYGPLGRTEIVARFLRALMTRASAEITASEARMRTVLEASPVGIFLTDAEGQPVYANSAYAAIAGHGVSELVQEGLAALIFPGDRSQAQLHDEETGHGSELRWERGDGTVAWVRLRSDAWVVDGEVAGRVGVVEDVTLEHEARARQTEAEERYHVLFSLAPEAIVSVDQNLDVVGFNASAERMFGYSLPEITGRPLDTLIPRQLRAGHRVSMEEFGRTHSAAARPMAARSEVCGLRRDGSEFACEASIVRQVLNGKLHFTAIVRETKDHHRPPAALTLLDDIPFLAWRLDERRQLVASNGLLPPNGEPSLVHSDDLAAYSHALDQALNEGTKISVRLRILDPSKGADRWHICGIQSLAAGGWTVVCADVHDLEVGAEELRRVRAVLGAA